MLACSILGLAACGGAQSAGSAGDVHWTLPLVDPLEGGLLITPVMIDGHGPYLFAIDPDATVSAVDTDVVKEANLPVGHGPRQVDEAGVQQTRLYAQIGTFKVGNLTLTRHPVLVVPVGVYDSAGRHFAGLLGHDVIADALAFGIDRDHGVVSLVTDQALHPPEGASEIEFHNLASQMEGLELPPPPRRVARAAINSELYSLHLDFGATASQLRPDHWASAELAASTTRQTLADEVATVREVHEVGIAKNVSIAGVTRFDTVFLAYQDARFETGVDGSLGLEFFAPFTTWMSWKRQTCFVSDRTATAGPALATRLARWDAAIPACPHPGCIASTIAAAEAAPNADGASPEAAAGLTITVTRDPESAGRPLQVVLAPVTEAGKPSAARAAAAGAKPAAAKPTAGQPAAKPGAGQAAAPTKPPPAWIVADLTAGATEATGALGPEYAGIALQVVDVSPFPRVCPGDASSCITRFGAADQPPPGPPPPPSITPDKLHRLTGDASIAPNATATQAIAAASSPPSIAVVKVCLTVDGTVESAKLVKSSKITAYDQQLLDDIKASWTFDPVVIDGSRTPACASFPLRPPTSPSTPRPPITSPPTTQPAPASSAPPTPPQPR